MHSPRRSARPDACGRGRSDPAASPENRRRPCRRRGVARAQRAIRPSADRVLRPHRQAARRLLEIQQAEIVLAALAHDGLQRLLRRDRDRAGRARRRSGAAGCACRSRSRPRRRSSPPTGWPARYSRASCRRRCRPRPARCSARHLASRGANAAAHRRGIVGLLRPRLRASAEQRQRAAAAPPPARPGCCRAAARAHAPTIPADPPTPPCCRGRDPSGGLRHAERRQHRRPPAPAAPRHGPGDRPRSPRGRRRRPRPARPAAARAAWCNAPASSSSVRRQRQLQRPRQAARRRQAELRRPHEGEELQQIERRKALDAQPRAPSPACGR